MKKLFWFATGIAAGLAVAKQMRENPEARTAVEDAAKRARAIGEAFTTGYKEREQEIKRTETAAKKPKAAAKKPSTASAAKPAAAKKPAAKKSAAKPSAK